MKIIRFIILPLILVGILYLFAFQPQVLLYPIFKSGSVPIGSLLSWGGLFVYALFFYLVLPFNTEQKGENVLKHVLFINVVLSALWGIISFLLLKNWSFNFDSSVSSSAWIVVTGLILVIPVLIAVILLVLKVVFNK